MNLSIDTERPGSYFNFVFTSRAGGFAALPQQVALVGIQTETTLPVGSITRLLSPEQADGLFGRGSELALEARAAFALGALRGRLPHIFGVPLAASADASAAATITEIIIAGSPTVADSLVVRIAGRSLRVGVTPTSTPDQIATDLSAQITGRSAELPVTAAVADVTVTCTNNWKGTGGNLVRFEASEVPAGLTVTITRTQDGAGDSDLEAALDATLARDFDALALPNPSASNVALAQDHANEAWAAGTKKWRLLFFGSIGTLADAQGLASADDYRLAVVAHRGARSLPSELAAAAATLAFSDSAPNYSFDGAVLPLYAADPADAWTVAEIEALLDAGVSPLGVSEQRADRMLLEKLVTTQVTQNGVPSFTLRDVAVPKVAAFVARQIEAQYRLRRPQSVDAIRDLILDVDRQAEAQGYIRNVAALRPGITVNLSEFVPGRAESKNPIDVVTPVHQAIFEIAALV